MVAIDALRGLAALAVVLFHYSFKYQELFGGDSRPSFSVPWGHYGVNLFFIVSGFVIQMTLVRTHTAMDFVVSRFSRLYPAYWVAVVLTFLVTATFGLPGKEVGLWQALANLSMVQGFAGVPHVDGVYWTLEVELLFYAGMLLLFALRQLERLHIVVLCLLTLRLVYEALRVGFGIDLPWTIYRFLILQYLPWFAIGIAIFQLTRPAPGVGRLHWRVVLGVAVVSLLAVDGPGVALLGVALAWVVWAAAAGRLPWLQVPPLVLLGALSYPLYLLHENIGWVLMREVQRVGWSADASIALALVVSIVLAWIVMRGVERPALRSIRSAWAQRSRPVR